MAVPDSVSVPVAASHAPVIPGWSANARTSRGASRPAPRATVAPDSVAESTSATVTPGSTATAGPSSVKVAWPPEVATTGASGAAMTWIVRVPAGPRPLPSSARRATVLTATGSWLVERTRTARSAAW